MELKKKKQKRTYSDRAGDAQIALLGQASLSR